MYAYEIYLGEELVSQSNYEYETEQEAESEGYFAVCCIADLRCIHWSEFRVIVCN